MEEIEFNKWPKINRFLNQRMLITEKLDGTNGQIVFKDGLFRVGSRTRWLTADNDNFGFYAWADKNKEELFEILGEGRHYGEWVGKGIQRGYNMENRKFYLFNVHREYDSKLSHLIEPVPVLYEGEIRMSDIWRELSYLNENGSRVNHFYNPEGMIVQIGGERYKIYTNQLSELGKLL